LDVVLEQLKGEELRRQEKKRKEQGDVGDDE